LGPGLRGVEVLGLGEGGLVGDGVVVVVDQLLALDHVGVQHPVVRHRHPRRRRGRADPPCLWPCALPLPSSLSASQLKPLWGTFTLGVRFRWPLASCSEYHPNSGLWTYLMHSKPYGVFQDPGSVFLRWFLVLRGSGRDPPKRGRGGVPGTSNMRSIFLSKKMTSKKICPSLDASEGFQCTCGGGGEAHPSLGGRESQPPALSRGEDPDLKKA